MDYNDKSTVKMTEMTEVNIDAAAAENKQSGPKPKRNKLTKAKEKLIYAVNDVKGLVISVRFLLAIVLFFGYTINYMQRTNMSIAIVCMVNATAVLERDGGLNNSNLNNNITIPTCVRQLTHETSKGKFVWSKADQGLILSAYFYGYTLTQIPGGWLAKRFGGRLVIIFAMLIPSILTIVTPFIANLNSPPLLIVVRFFIGFIHGVMFSAIADLFAQWTPVRERATILAFASSGVSFGAVVSSILGGFLCEYGFMDGWGSIFILFGSFGLVWLILLLLLTSDSPKHHWFIKKEETEYILANIPISEPIKKTPWKKIFTSKACWAIFIANFCYNWGEYIFLTQTPTYLSEVLNFDIKANGIFSALPFVASFFFTIISGIISDKCVQNNVITTLTSRKIFNSLGMFVPMILVVFLGFVDCTKSSLAIALLTIGVGMIGCVLGAGFVVSINDIGGNNYSGIIFGISNSLGNIPGIIAPYFVGLMTPHATIEEWRIVFIVTAVIYFVGAIPFIIFAQADVEKWAMSEPESESEPKSDPDIKSEIKIEVDENDIKI